MRLVCIIPADQQETAQNDPVLEGGGWDVERVSAYDPNRIFYICNWRMNNHAEVYDAVRNLTGGKAYYFGTAPEGKEICSSVDGDEETSACKLYSPNLVIPETDGE